MTLRRLAIVLGVAAVGFPFAVLAGGFFMPVEDGSQPAYEDLRPIAVIIVVSGVLSVSGLAAGLAALLRTAPPRPAARKLECLATGLPFVLYLLFAAAFYIVFTLG